MTAPINPGLRKGPHRVVTLDDGQPLPPVGKVKPAAELTHEEHAQRWERMEREWNEAAEFERKSHGAWAEWLVEDARLWPYAPWPSDGPLRA